MPSWAIVLLVIAALAAIVMYMKHRHHPMQHKAVAAHKSSKHGWRHRLGGIAKLAEHVPGAGGYVKSIEGAANIVGSSGVLG
jgi:hypothetical protein